MQHAWPPPTSKRIAPACQLTQAAQLTSRKMLCTWHTASKQTPRLLPCAQMPGLAAGEGGRQRWWGRAGLAVVLAGCGSGGQAVQAVRALVTRRVPHSAEHACRCSSLRPHRPLRVHHLQGDPGLLIERFLAKGRLLSRQPTDQLAVHAFGWGLAHVRAGLCKHRRARRPARASLCSKGAPAGGGTDQGGIQAQGQDGRVFRWAHVALHTVHCTRCMLKTRCS